MTTEDPSRGTEGVVAHGEVLDVSLFPTLNPGPITVKTKGKVIPVKGGLLSQN